MSEIFCTGLKAGTPIGFLAALGMFRHASRMATELGEVQLRWARRGGEWCAVLVTERDLDGAQFLSLFVTRICELGVRPEFGWAEQIKKNLPETFRMKAERDAWLLDWFSAFGTELIVSKDGTLRSTMLDMTGGQQKFLLKLREGSSALTGSAKGAEALMREALFGPWLYERAKKAAEAENSHSMGLDPSTQLVGAFTAEEPAGIKDKRGIRGAIWLAFESLPFFPCMVDDGRLRTTGFFNHRESDGWKNYFEWGVWDMPLSLAVCRILLSQPREEWTRGRGIQERFRSERVNLNKDYYSLGPAELVVG